MSHTLFHINCSDCVIADKAQMDELVRLRNSHDEMVAEVERLRELSSGQSEDVAHAYLMLRELVDACSCGAEQKVLEKYAEARAVCTKAKS